MSKRLQISISEEIYEKLIRLCNETGSPSGWSKSTVIEIALSDLYHRIDKNDAWNNWDNATKVIRE